MSTTTPQKAAFQAWAIQNISARDVRVAWKAWQAAHAAQEVRIQRLRESLSEVLAALPGRIGPTAEAAIADILKQAQAELKASKEE